MDCTCALAIYRINIDLLSILTLPLDKVKKSPEFETPTNSEMCNVMLSYSTVLKRTLNTLCQHLIFS